MIYANFGREEQLGWMSRATPDCIFPQTDPYLQHILRSLARINVHDLPGEKIKWLYHWCGAYECIRTFNEGKQEEKNMFFSSRVAFLQRVWHEPQFRPFDTIDSSIQFLHQTQDITSTARLSTTRPGYITVTTQSGSNFTHTRYQVLSNSSIVDSKGNQHHTISSLTSSV